MLDKTYLTEEDLIRLGDAMPLEGTRYRMKDLMRENPNRRPKVKRKPSVEPKRTRKLQKQARKYNR